MSSSVTMVFTVFKNSLLIASVSFTAVGTCTVPEYGASFTVPSSNTSMLGIPEMSFTENIVPLSPSDIENNCPAVPSNDRVPLSKTFSVSGVLSAPINLIVG